LELNPDLVLAHNNLALTYAKKGLLKEAIDEFKRAIELNPRLPTVHYNLGLAYSEKGLLTEAIEEYRKELELAPQNPDAHLNLAVAAYLKGQYDLAWVHARRAEKLQHPKAAQIIDILKKVSREPRKEGSHIKQGMPLSPQSLPF